MPDQLLVVPSMSSNTLTVIDLDDHAVVRHVGLPRRGPSTIFASPDGAKLYCLASAACNVVVVDVATWAPDHVVKLGGTVVDRGRVPDHGADLWVAVIPQGHIHVVDTATGTVRRSFPKMGPSFTISTDGEHLFTLDVRRPREPATLRSRLASTGEVIAETALPAMRGLPLGMEHHDGRIYQVELAKAGALHVVDVTDPATPAYGGRVGVGSAPLGSTFLPNGEIWLPNSADGTVSVIDSATMTVSRTLDVGRYVGSITHVDGRVYLNRSRRAGRVGFWRSMWITIPGPYVGTYVTPASGSPRSRRVLDHAAEVVAYDAATGAPVDLPPLPLPSMAFTSAVVPRPAPDSG